ncbi:hypothetical protein SAY86_011295 [Trapa natans]|uniref:Uncharacterized protein n=1 Tax=Trapa natans TaxID=22666 RepID=A0AAN7LWR5_TRANT|nr:hypothetical protein SAY86_011295 [Trapa natans]
MPPTGMHMMPPPPYPSKGSPPPEEAPTPLPEEPEPKRRKLDDSLLVQEDQFLAQHRGAVRINVCVPNLDEGNLKGQVLEITVQSLSETVGNLKEKIAGETQLPANKQKLSGKPGPTEAQMARDWGWTRKCDCRSSIWTKTRIELYGRLSKLQNR